MNIFGLNFDLNKNKASDDVKVSGGKTEVKKENNASNLNITLENYKRNIKKKNKY